MALYIQFVYIIGKFTNYNFKYQDVDNSLFVNCDFKASDNIESAS